MGSEIKRENNTGRSTGALLDSSQRRRVHVQEHERSNLRLLAAGALLGYAAASGYLLRNEQANGISKTRKCRPQQSTGVPGSPGATTTIDGRVSPNPPPKFGGKINLSAKDSKPWWPPTVVPPKGAPTCCSS